MHQHQKIQCCQQRDPQPFTGEAGGDARQVAPNAEGACRQCGKQRQNQCGAGVTNATTEDQRAKENQPAHHQPLRPIRHVRHRSCQDALVLTISVKQPPVTTYRTFAGALPRLVKGFDQVVVPALLLGHGDKTANELGLIDSARQGGFTLTAFARPACFANHHVLGREFVAEYLAHFGHMLQCGIDVRRIIFPVRQQVDGQEVHGRCDFRMFEPELPDVGVSDRLFDVTLDLVDQLRQLRAGDFLAQQGFVADDHGGHYVGVRVGRGNQQVDLFFGVHRVAVDPGADHQLQAVLARQIGQGFEAGHGVGADAFETLRQQREVGVHALGTQIERHIERRLVFVERRVGRALQLVRRAGDVRQNHRFTNAVPEAAKGKKSQQAGE
ncbi:hypothetical protein D3C71_892110 [compost metagenome]